MKKMKKALAVILSLAMVLGMSLTAFATEAKYPEATDHNVVTVSGLKQGDKVTFYKLTEPEFNSNKAFVGWKAIEIGEQKLKVTVPSDPKDAMVLNPTEITNIAKAVTEANIAKNVDGIDAVVTSNGESVSQDLTVGTYLVLVQSANDDTIYNPMVASVYYTVDGTAVANVSAGQDFEVNGQKVYAKSSDVNLTKEITSPKESENNVKGNDVAIGDTIGFKVTADVPSYSDEYDWDTLVYKLTDVLDGLNSVSNIKVYLDNSTEALNNDNVPEDKDYTSYYNLTIQDDDTSEEKGTGYIIEFDRMYIKELSSAPGTHKFTVTYDAVLAEDAGINFDANNNKVTLEYTNKPGTQDNIGKIEKETYHYTFGIDANLNGEDSYKTGELFKTEGGGTKYVENDAIGGTVSNPLKGAQFSLQKADKGEDGSYTAIAGFTPLTSTSAEDGRISFKGLDAGYYILKETKAPSGYTLNETPYYIDIVATYDENTGKLQSYSITVNGNDITKTSSYELKPNQGTDPEVTEIIDHTTDASFFVNTKLADLPSTGGIGTTIFTIGGCAIMIIAAALFFASRRRAVK